MVLDSCLDIRPTTFGLAIASAHTNGSPQGLKGQRPIPDSGHNCSRLDTSTNTNFFEVI